MCEISLKLTIKTPEQHQSGTNFTHCSGVSIVDFEHANDGQFRFENKSFMLYSDDGYPYLTDIYEGRK